MKIALLVIAAALAVGSGALAIQPWYSQGGRFVTEFLVPAGVFFVIAVGIALVAAYL